jgi:hypothetical protein
VLAQDGLVLNKDDQIARVLAFESPNQNPTRTVDLRRISFEGNVAIITGVVTISVANGAFSTAFTEVWARKGERWLAKAAHYSTIQLPAE